MRDGMLVDRNLGVSTSNRAWSGGVVSHEKNLMKPILLSYGKTDLLVSSGFIYGSNKPRGSIKHRGRDIRLECLW